MTSLDEKTKVAATVATTKKRILLTVLLFLAFLSVIVTIILILPGKTPNDSGTTDTLIGVTPSANPTGTSKPINLTKSPGIPETDDLTGVNGNGPNFTNSGAFSTPIKKPTETIRPSYATMGNLPIETDNHYKPTPTTTNVITSTPTSTKKSTAKPTVSTTATKVPTSTPSATDSGNIPSISTSTNVGDIIKFGQYEQDNNTSNGKEDIEWIVLAKENNRILVISKYALDSQPYNTSAGYFSWDSCTLRAWLNDTFLNNAFTSAEKNKIPAVTIIPEDNGFKTNDKVFLLSTSEANKYFSSDNARMCYATSYAKAQGVFIRSDNESVYWWLRTSGYIQKYATCVYYNGFIFEFGESVSIRGHAVRPAMWITLG